MKTIDFSVKTRGAEYAGQARGLEVAEGANWHVSLDELNFFMEPRMQPDGIYQWVALSPCGKFSKVLQEIGHDIEAACKDVTEPA